MEHDSTHQLSGDELTELAQRMVDAADPLEAGRLREEIVKGFYGRLDQPKPDNIRLA